MKYQNAVDSFEEATGIIQRQKAGKLHPVALQRFGPSEGGVVSVNTTLELEPIVGRMLTNITAHFYAVYVPDRAIDALKHPEHDLPGNDESLRERLLAGDDIFGLEPESEISKELGIVPINIDGVSYVSELARLAYIAANNTLRKRLYYKAALLDASVTTIQPALLGSTVLQRYNAVLNPEDRVNGAVNFEGQIPVRGVGVNPGVTPTGTGATEFTTGVVSPSSTYLSTDTPIKVEAILEDTNWRPNVYADLGQSGADVSLRDFYDAQRVDALTREVAQLVEAYPEYGEQIIARFVHGLSMDMGKQPAVLFERELQFANNLVRGMDGPSLNVVQTQNILSYPVTLPVPKNEFGGTLVVLCSIKPDEVNAAQPHPRLTEEYKTVDYYKDEMLVHEPQRVTARQVDAEVSQADEGTLVFYNGNNHLKKRYSHYGFSRNLTSTQIDQIADKNTLWRYEIPLSVTPDNIIYPATVELTPFAVTDGDVCIAQVVKKTRGATPLIFGDVPVEELAAIEDQNIFGDLDV